MSAHTVSTGQTIKVLILAALSVLLVDFLFSGVKRALGSSTNDYSNLAYQLILYLCVGALTARYVYKSVAGIHALLGILTGGFALLVILRLILGSLVLQRFDTEMDPEEMAIAVFKGAIFAAFAMGTALGMFVLLFRTTEPRLGHAFTSDPAKVLDRKGKHSSTLATCSSCGQQTEIETTGFFGRSEKLWCRYCSAFIGGNPLPALTAGVAWMVFCGFASIGAAGMIGPGPLRPSTSVTFLFLLGGFGHGLRLAFDGVRGYAKNAASASSTSGRPGVVVEQARASNSVTYCSGCGNTLADGARFCGQCGVAVQTAVPVPQLEREKSPPFRSVRGRQGATPFGLAMVLILLSGAAITVLYERKDPGSAVRTSAPSTSQSAQAAPGPVTDKQTDMAKAADMAVATYAEEGMSGLAVKTSKCYEKNRTNLQCLYLDLASRHIDQVFVTGGFPAYEFFSDEHFLERTSPVLKEAKIDMNDASDYLALAALLVNRLVEKTFLERYPTEPQVLQR